MGQNITKQQDNNREHVDNGKQKPRLLGIVVGKKALNNAEYIDKYRTNCGNSWPNKIARLNQTYAVSDLGKENKLEEELKVLEYVPKWISQKTDVVFLHESADGGMPHTRPGIICIPNGIKSPNIKSTIIHEAVHISQRNNPKLWDIVYENAWNMKKFIKTIPFELEVYRRYNPDTFMAGYYIWNDKWVIVPVYRNKNEPELSKIKLVFYNVENGEWLSFIPKEWEIFVGSHNKQSSVAEPLDILSNTGQLSVAEPLDILSNTGQLSVAEQEHPHEMAAYIVQRFFEGEDVTKNYEKKLLQQLNLYFPEMGIPYIK